MLVSAAIDYQNLLIASQGTLTHDSGNPTATQINGYVPGAQV